MTQNLRTWLLGTVAIVVAGVVVGRLFLGEPEVAAPAITPAEAKGYFGLLPQVADNPQNPVTPAKVELGKALFFEPRLSKSGFIACASCHHLASGGGDGLATSIGHRWQVSGRNAPTVLNAALHLAQSWDGGAADVEDHAGQPISNPGGMASSETLVLKRLRSIPAYPERFRAAFPDDAEPLSYTNVARAIAAFERTLITPGRLDRFLAGDATALTPEEHAGLERFVAVGCTGCHNGATLGGGSFQKFGVVRAPEGLTDPGRFEVTKNEADRFVFKVPSLRNIALTAPYFHDGSVWTIEEAVQIMADTQLGTKLSLADAASVATFLRSLDADPPLTVTLPLLPASTATTPRPEPN
ncbi:MAG: cytochrome-c peroxidase [Gammaproteobacteria bacterium]